MAKFENLITPDALQFLENYLNTYSPTGYEAPGQQLWLDYISPYVDTCEVDNYGTVYGIIKNTESDYKVVIEAHGDEISWYVSYITEDGFLHVIRNGGSDQQIAPAKRVLIHTRTGKQILGIFGWPAIHLRYGNGKELTPTLENITIDCGCNSKEEVEAMGIHVGCVVTYQEGFMQLNENTYTGRALDNRIGGFMIAQVARLIKENNIKLPYNLYIVNTVQEEVGLRGAEMIVQKIRPDVAIVTDVAHDTNTPLITKPSNGDIKIGKGAIIDHAPAVHNKLLDLIYNAAHEQEIPYQRLANSRSTGTNTDAYAYTGGGVVSALISLPLRYMHTTVETVRRQDVESVIQLIYYTLQKIENQHNFKYIHLPSKKNNAVSMPTIEQIIAQQQEIKNKTKAKSKAKSKK